MAKFRISYLVSSDEIGLILQRLTPEQIASMQLTPEEIAPWAGVRSGEQSQKALRRALDVVRPKKQYSGLAGVDIINEPPESALAFRKGSSLELMYQFIKQHNGTPVTQTAIMEVLNKRGFGRNTNGLARLVDLGLVKRIDLGRYVLASGAEAAAKARPTVTLKPGGAADLILKEVKQKKQITAGEIAALLNKHGLVTNQQAIRRLMRYKYLKKTGKGEYVYTGKE